MRKLIVLLTRLMAQVRRIEPHMARLFAVQPRAPYDVARLNPMLEGALTFGYYQQPTSSDATGRYLYNGSKLNERNLLFAPALMAHELVPGHHSRSRGNWRTRRSRRSAANVTTRHSPKAGANTRRSSGMR